jgi:DNA replication protein DnaC
VRLLTKLARVDVLVIDDWGLSPPREAEKNDLLEILEDRCGSRATIMTSQVDPSHWHQLLGEPTIADAIVDRILNRAHKIMLKGPSKGKEEVTTK